MENIGRETSVAFLSRVLAPPGTKRLPFVPAAGSTRDKRPIFFVSVGVSNRDKRPLSPLAWLAIGPGTKATYCPGSKDSRDKWPGTKTYSVVVNISLKT